MNKELRESWQRQNNSNITASNFVSRSLSATFLWQPEYEKEIDITHLKMRKTAKLVDVQGDINENSTSHTEQKASRTNRPLQLGIGCTYYETRRSEDPY